jgi:hypothetical protein
MLGCSPKYNTHLVPNNRFKTINNPFGSYIELSTNSKVYKGEFIGYLNDSIYVLSNNSLERINKDSIESFNIILTQSSEHIYLTYIAIILIPSLVGLFIHYEFSGEFATLGAFTLLFSIPALIGEGVREGHVISFPKDNADINAFVIYARFPEGIPKKIKEVNSESNCVTE